MKLNLVLLLAVAVLLVVLVAWIWIDHHRDKRALVEYKQNLVAAGEKLTVEELIPKPPPVDRDGTAIFSKAEALMRGISGLLSTNPPPSMRAVAVGRAMIGWKQPDVRDSEATNTWDEVRGELAGYAEAFELLHQFIDRPVIDSHLNYAEGHSLPLPGLVGRKLAVQRLNASVVCNLHKGDVASAASNARAMLALAKGSTDERLVISQLVRMAIATIAVAANWELLQSPEVTEDQLLALQRDWEELEFLQAAEHAVEMERAMGMVTADEMRTSGLAFKQFSAPWYGTKSGQANSPGTIPGQAWQFAKDSWEKTRTQVKRAAWRIAWANPDQLSALKGTQALLDAVRLARKTGAILPALKSQDRELEKLGLIRKSSANDTGPFDGFAERDTRMLLSESVISLHSFPTRTMVMEASRRMVITAIALKRYQLRHSRLPTALSELVPEFLLTVPRDAVDGQPLRYRLTDQNTYLLYSVGEDGVDDGGDARPANETSKSRNWRNGRDWVWPQPAPPEQVAAYYDEVSLEKP